MATQDGGRKQCFEVTNHGQTLLQLTAQKIHDMYSGIIATILERFVGSDSPFPPLIYFLS
jgi:hypothetical protein